MDKFIDEKEMLKTRFVVDEAKESEQAIAGQDAGQAIAGEAATGQNVHGQATPASISPEEMTKLLAQADSELSEPQLVIDDTNVLAENDKVARKIIKQTICLAAALGVGAGVSLVFPPVSTVVFLAMLLFLSQWVTGTLTRAQKLVSPEQSHPLLKRISCTSPFVTLICSAIFFTVLSAFDRYFHFSANITIDNLINLISLGCFGSFLIHIGLRLSWIFWYPTKLNSAINQIAPSHSLKESKALQTFVLFTTLGIGELLLIPALAGAVGSSGLGLAAQMIVLSTQAALFYLINQYIGKLERLRGRGKNIAALVRAEDGRYLDEDVIGYKPMAGTERWMKQRFSHGSWWKPVLLLLMVAGILMLNPGQILQDFLTYLFKDSVPSTVAGAKTALQAFFNFNHLFVLLFGGVFLSCVGGLGVWLLSLPTAIISGPRGLRYRYRKLIGRVDADLPWSELKEIRLERKLNSSSTLSDCVIFKTDKKALKLKLDNFKSGQDKEKLLHAIEAYAHAVPRDPQVMEALALPADHSYTEVWMAALSAPPKRERLKPLTEDAVMNEGNYKVVKELGSGGQGFAYLAKDRDGKEVVLKEFVLPIYVDIQARRKALERFENEARLLSRLDHPQVVKLQGFFIEDHRAYLVLEHIDGKNLRQIIDERGCFSQEEARVLLGKMSKILAYLHDLDPPLVHRDFTPDNLIMDKDGNLKLIDFNVAQEMQDGTTGTVVGKQAYLPPEQFRGQAEPASDLYAMGATLYYILTGKDPTPISTLKIAKEMPDIDPALDSLMTRLTSMDAKLRPTARDVLQGQGQGPELEPGLELRPAHELVQGRKPESNEQ